MSYATIAVLASAHTLHLRIAACAAVEGESDPGGWVSRHAWRLAAQPGWAAAWASAVELHDGEPGYDPGADEAAITDSDILAAVQALRTDGEELP